LKHTKKFAWQLAPGDIAFPYAKNPPTPPSKKGRDRAVSRNVASYFIAPKRAINFWLGVSTIMPVPKTTIGKHRHPLFRKNKIRLAI